MARTVTVACKVPNGLILRLFDMVDVEEPVMGGGVRVVKRARPRDGQVTLNGPAVPYGERRPAGAGGYAYTFGVDAEFFEEWLKQNAETDVVRNELVKHAASRSRLDGVCRDLKDVRSGLEPITPDKDKRIPPRIRTANQREDEDEAVA